MLMISPLPRGRNRRLCCPLKNIHLRAHAILNAVLFHLRAHAILNAVLVIGRSVHECQFLGMLHCFSTIQQFP